MFSRILNQSLRTSLSIPQYGDEMFALIDRNRGFLRKWLSWIDDTQSPQDTKTFLQEELEKFSQGKSLHISIFWEDALAGAVAFNSIDQTNQTGYIGYWLGAEFTKKGIMTLAVADLIEIGRTYYGLQKMDIRCATGNLASRAIPQRLGFTHETTLPQAEIVSERWLDHEIYILEFEDEGLKKATKQGKK